MLSTTEKPINLSLYRNIYLFLKMKISPSTNIKIYSHIQKVAILSCRNRILKDLTRCYQTSVPISSILRCVYIPGH